MTHKLFVLWSRSFVSLLSVACFGGTVAIDPPASSRRVVPEQTIERTANFLPNPGFERAVGGVLPEYWSRFGQLNQACPNSRVVTNAAFEGKQCARLAAGETLRVPTEVAKVRQSKESVVDGREPYVLSVYLRRAPGQGAATSCKLGLWAQVDVDDGDPRPELFERTCALADEWQRFELPVLVDLVLGTNRWGVMGALFEARIGAVGGDVLVDAVQLEYGEAATPYAGETVVLPAAAPASPAVDDLAWVMQGLEKAGENSVGTDRGVVGLRARRPTGCVGGYEAAGAVLFARGTLFQGDSVRLYDAAGKPVPVQTQTLARYAMDGSIRSLYVVFPVPGNAGTDPEFMLQYGPGVGSRPRMPSAVTVSQRDGEVVVNTGPLRFTMRRDGFRLFDHVWLDGNADGTHAADECVLDASNAGGLTVVDDGGARWESRLDAPTLVVERAGPVEAVIRAQGWHRDAAGNAKVGYIVRVFAYAGSSAVKVEHTFENLTPTGSPGTGLRSVSLSLPLAGIVDSEALAGGKRLPGRSGFYALQTATDDDSRGTVVTSGELCGSMTVDGREPLAVSSFDGSFRFRTRHGVMGLRVEDFGANHPLAVGAGKQGVTLEFWPSRGVKTLLLTHGMAKTHRFWLGFAKPGSPHSALAGTGRAAPDSSYTMATGATTWGTTPGDGTFRNVETTLARTLDLKASVVDVVTPIGKFDFGDFPHAHTSRGWGNSETALSRNWLVQAVRAGDERAFRIGERLIHHTIDVDIDHVHGNQYTHNMHHALGGTGHSCHDYAEMLSLYYLLTGDALVLDLNRRNAASSRETVTTKWRRWLTGRAHGWPAWHVAEMCDVTCEKADLDAGRAIARRFRESIKVEDGKWVSLSGKGGLLYGGTNLNALMHIHLATGAEDAKVAFLDELDHVIKQVRDAGDWQFGNRNSIMADPLVYAWRLTGKRSYIEYGIEATERAAQNGDCYLVNCVPLLAAAAELGIKPSASVDSLGWGFKRKHTMYVSLPQGTPCRGSYVRHEASKESEWWYKLSSPDGKLAAQLTSAPMTNGQGEISAPASNQGQTWRLDVHQGYPALVDFAFPEAKGAVLRVDPGMRRFTSGPERYWFLVPEDAKEVRIAVRKYYGNGTAGLAVYGPDQALVDVCRWTPVGSQDEREWHELVISPPEGSRGKLWSMVIAMYDGQYQLRMAGVPAFVSLTPEAWFLPRVGTGD